VSRTLVVGTKKGLFLQRNGRLDGPLLPGWEVYHGLLDPRTGTLYAAANNFVYGATVQRSDDLGETWQRSEPIEGLARAWHVEPTGEPGTLWLGGDPGMLFRSEDGGRAWEPNAGLAEHPTRDRWNPGAGGLCCHSVQVAPDGTLYTAISAAGAFRSDDGGDSWSPINGGVAADFMPDPYPEVGQCVHKLLLHPADPDRLWQQNHCGTYRSDDRGETWQRLDGNGLPSSFGFGIALDPGDPDVAYVIPEEGAEYRVTAQGRLGVYRTTDGGASWEPWGSGLPEHAWTGVLREGMSFDADGVYFGTQSGSLFGSHGDAWEELASQLPPVLSVEACTA
jgi:photosystem II stability/assembly factor-like uncharacterized protein